MAIPGRQENDTADSSQPMGLLKRHISVAIECCVWEAGYLATGKNAILGVGAHRRNGGTEEEKKVWLA